VIKDFLPEIKSLSDDFIHMLCQVRNKNDVVERFEGFSNIMGLESMCDRTMLLANVNLYVIVVLIP